MSTNDRIVLDLTVIYVDEKQKCPKNLPLGTPIFKFNVGEWV